MQQNFLNAERRMSLMDYFLNSNNQNQVGDTTPALVQAQPQSSQIQVQQPQPNQLVFVRDSGFPSSSGGLLSRMIMARRMLRLQRLSNRLQVLPMLMGIRQIQVQQPQARLLQQQQPQQQGIYLNNRAGPLFDDGYNPSDVMKNSQNKQQQRQNNLHNEGSFFGNKELPNQQLKDFHQSSKFEHFNNFGDQDFDQNKFFEEAQQNFKEPPLQKEHESKQDGGYHKKEIHIGGGAKPIVVQKPTIVDAPVVVHKPPPVVAHQQVHKPVVAEAPLVPLGLLPKPLLNINGKLFFGAELGKGAGVKVR